MRLIVNSQPDIDETQIIINCRQMDDKLNKLIELIKQFTFVFQAKAEAELCLVPAEEVYYIESVDSKTFLYCEKDVYSVSETLYEIERELTDSAFIRISKSCIVNLSYLAAVRPFWNHRLEAKLKNGESLIVTRSYIDNLRKKLNAGGKHEKA